MKNKFYIVAALLFLVSLAVVSQSRSQEEALGLALSFLNSSSTQGQRVPLDAAALEPVEFSDTLLANSVYVFNVADNRGYVMVSGDERARAILGWSDRSGFDYRTIPENFRYWVSVYQDELQLLRNRPAKPVPIRNTVQAVQPVSPLLGAIKWNQGSPYNALCPVINNQDGTRAVTGCVATGMAQLMYYHRWPERGTGSQSYTTTTLKIPLELDFSSANYNWEQMTPQYGSSSSEEAKAAVATIMYHSGVAVNMDYNTTSSASISTMGRALYQHFSYDPNLQLVFRNYMSRTEWQQLLMNELYAARPILYGGTGSDNGGHLWVCDGVDQNGYFHFNWGWGGAYDGYFSMTALNPDGIGGDAESGGYNFHQQAVIGVQKPTQGSTPVVTFYMNDPLENTVPGALRTQTFSINARRIYNYGLQKVSLQLALGIYNGSSLVNVLKSHQINDLASNYGWNTFSFSNMSVPATVPAGNYQLKLMYRTDAGQDWRLVPVRIGVPAWIDTRITSDSVVFSQPAGEWPLLTLQEMKPIGNVYSEKTGRFSLTVHNTGREYNSSVMIKLTPLAGGDPVFETSREWLSLLTNESGTLSFAGEVNAPAGDYVMTAYYDVANNYSNPLFQQLGDTVRIKIRTTPVTPPALALEQAISFPANNAVVKSNADLSATITNTGGYFDNKVIAFIFTPTGPSSIAYLGYRNVIIDSLETVTLHFKGEIVQEAGNYRIGVYQNTANGWSRLAPTNWSMINFTLINDTITSVNDLEASQVKVFPNPATDYIMVLDNQPIESVEIFSADGRRVGVQKVNMESSPVVDISDLKPGVYILKLMGDKNKVIRFVKK